MVQAHAVKVQASTEPTAKSPSVFVTTTADYKRNTASPSEEHGNARAVTQVEAMVDQELPAKAVRKELAMLQREVAKLQNDVNLLKSAIASSITAASQKSE
jgi:hypothetical protein